MRGGTQLPPICAAASCPLRGSGSVLLLPCRALSAATPSRQPHSPAPPNSRLWEPRHFAPLPQGPWPWGGTYRRTILSRLSLLARGSSRTLEARVTSSARGTAVSSSTFRTIFSRRTRRTGGSRVALGEANHRK